MEKILLRFSVIGKKILNYLSNQSLIKSQEASKEIAKFIDDETFFVDKDN